MADIVLEAAAGSLATNPMRDDDDDDANASAVGLGKHHERRLREDTNAVACPDFFARARAWTWSLSALVACGLAYLLESN